MSTSYWSDQDTSTSFPKLQENLSTDIVIIGGGMTGLLSAYELCKAGKKVVLLERNQIGSGETLYTTAFLTYVTDTSLQDLHGTFGDEGATLTWSSGQKSIDQLERISKEEGIDCKFTRCPLRITATSQEERKHLLKEQELAQSFGFPLSFSEEITPLGTHGTLLVPDQATFHPIHFLHGLAKGITKLGGKIFEESPVEQFDSENPHRLQTSNGSVTGASVIVATHSPINNRFEAPMRLASTQSYVLRAILPKGSIPSGLYLDTQNPYHYLRIDEGAEKDALILGGEDVPTGDDKNTEERFTALERYLQTTILPKTHYTITHRWSGQLLETTDGLPYIGRSFECADHYIACGYAGNGITFAAVAARLLTDLLLKKESPEEALFTPKRLKGIGTLLKDGAHVLTEYLRGAGASATDTLEEIKPGEGKVIEHHGKKLAVFRTPAGALLCVSAICTHLGCTVRWNSTQTEWDCPCHGSRFDVQGRVLNGPAIDPLAPATFT